jgi:hypothetical protein
MREILRHHGMPAMALLVVGILGAILHFVVPHIESASGSIGDMCLMEIGTPMMCLGMAGALFIAGLLWRRAYDERWAIFLGFLGAVAGAAVMFYS